MEPVDYISVRRAEPDNGALTPNVVRRFHPAFDRQVDTRFPQSHIDAGKHRFRTASDDRVEPVDYISDRQAKPDNGALTPNVLRRFHPAFDRQVDTRFPQSLIDTGENRRRTQSDDRVEPVDYIPVAE